MKALILNKYNTPFELRDIPKPKIKAGEVLVKIKTSGVNPVDIAIKAGKGPHAQLKLPGAVLGIDMSGIIDAVGDGIKNFSVGDEVFGMVGGIAGMQGTLAEYVAVDPALLALKPSNLNFKQAAAMPLNIITAFEAMIDRAVVRKGNKVLIHGGEGGVGFLAIQIARASGAEVFATATTDQEATVRAFGATPIVHAGSTVYNYVDEFTGGDGFDVVLDATGGPVPETSFNTVKRHTGRLVSILGYGMRNQASPSSRGASFSGMAAPYPVISEIDRYRHGQTLTDAALLIATGKMRPMVDDRNFSLESVDEAYQCIENGTAKGNIIISINNFES